MVNPLNDVSLLGVSEQMKATDLKRLQDSADSDGFNFMIYGDLGNPPYHIATTDGRRFWLRDSVCMWNGATHRQIFDRAMREGRLTEWR